MAHRIYARRGRDRRGHRLDLLEHASTDAFRCGAGVGRRARDDAGTGSVCVRRPRPLVQYDVSAHVSHDGGADDDAAGICVDALGGSDLRCPRVRSLHVGGDEGWRAPAGGRRPGLASGAHDAADGAVVAAARRRGASARGRIPSGGEADNRPCAVGRVSELANGRGLRGAARGESGDLARVDRGVARRLRDGAAHRCADHAVGRTARAAGLDEMEARRRASPARPRMRAAHDGALRDRPAVSDCRDVAAGMGPLGARGGRLLRAVGDGPVPVDRRAMERRRAVDRRGDVPAVPGDGVVETERVELTASAARRPSTCRR